MKKALLTVMLASMLALTARAQVLENTLWRAYDFSNTPSWYWHFTQDSLFYGADTISYVYVANYTTFGTFFVITNATLWFCFQSDTGTYNFYILADTLRFLIDNDLCGDRIVYLTTHYFVRLPTGIEDINSISTASIYPNPSADGIFNITFHGNGSMPERIYVLNVDGRKIMDVGAIHESPVQSSAEINFTINLQSCASGIYFLVMENEKGRRVSKLVR